MDNQVRYEIFQTNISLSDGLLRSSISFSDDYSPSEDMEYLFYLLKDGQVIDYGEWLKVPEKTWNITENGIYCTQGYIKNSTGKIWRRSFPVSFFTDEFRKKYDDFLYATEDICVSKSEIADNLPFIKSEYPYADFCMVSLYQDGTEIETLIDEFISVQEGFEKKFIDFDKGSFLVTNGTFIQGKDSEGLFSGISRSETKIIIGASDITNAEELELLDEGYGSFTGIIINKEKSEIKLIRDGFGSGKIFVYEDGEMVCFGNNYHLFLLFLKELNRPLKFDDEKVSIILSCDAVQLLNQNICRDMDVSPIQQCPTDYIYRYKEGGWKREITSYGNIIHDTSTPYGEEEYKGLIKQAVSEMQKSMQLVCSDNRFDFIHIDLSGGMDSRLVYALATNLSKEDREKVRIVSYSVPGTDDLEIATEINSIFGFKWDDLPRLTERESIEESDAYMRNRELGIYYSYNPYILKYDHEAYKYIRLHGSFSETLARPFASRHYISMIPDDSKLNSIKLAELVLADISYKINAPVNGSFVKRISKELDSIGCESVYESYESMHRQFHHGSHHNYQMYFEWDERRWSVLQSKTAILLHHNMMKSYKSSKLHFELIGEANPILLGFRYDYQKNNDDYSQISSQLCVEERFKGISNVRGDVMEMEHWKAADQIRKNSQKCKNPMEFPSEYYNSTRNEMVKDRTKSLLKRILRKRPVIEKAVGIELYYYICGDKVKWQYFYNKLSSFNDELSIAGL